MRKLHVLLAAFLITVMFLPACAPARPDCTSEEIFCVGLVTDIGKVNDRS
jgi:basic membrane protein A